MENDKQASNNHLDEIEKKVNYIKGKVDESYKTFTERRLWNKKAAFTTKIVITIATALISVVTGINLAQNGEFTNILNICVLIISAFITVLTTWDTFYRHKDLWIQYTEIVSELRNLKIEIEFYSLNPETISTRRVNGWLNDYQRINDESVAFWKQLRTKKEQDKIKSEEEIQVEK